MPNSTAAAFEMWDAKVLFKSAQEKKPRLFGPDPDERYLYAANKHSPTIVEFGVNQDTGELTPNGQTIETGSPSCIVVKSRRESPAAP